jgi:hypothetical protein
MTNMVYRLLRSVHDEQHSRFWDSKVIAVLGLPKRRSHGYRSSMDDTVWMMLVGIGGVVLWLLIFQRYRRWKAGKLADQLLQDVIKGKDAFRR